MHGPTSHSVFRLPALFSPVPCALFPATHACRMRIPGHDRTTWCCCIHRGGGIFLPFPPIPFPSPSWQCSDVAQHLATHGSCRRPVPTPGSPTSLPHCRSARKAASSLAPPQVLPSKTPPASAVAVIQHVLVRGDADAAASLESQAPQKKLLQRRLRGQRPAPEGRNKARGGPGRPP